MTRIVLTLIAAMIGSGGEYSAVVVERSALVFAKPDEKGYLTNTLARGARVHVRGEREDGWSAIEAGPEEFDWIDANLIAPGKEPGTSVLTSRATLRVGCSNARLPGPPGTVLNEGTIVERLNRSPLVVKGANGSTTWVAVRPPEAAFRFVRTREIRPLRTARTDVDDQVKLAGLEEPPLPQAVADELVRIDASHASMLKEPLDAWNLEPIRLRYEALLRSTTDSNSKEVIGYRLAKVRRETTLSDSAKRFSALVRKSRERDAKLERMKAKLDSLKEAEREAYTAVGLIQPSSKEINGRKVHVLIGADGANVAYLDIPQGIDVDQFLTTRVGVRGNLRYDEKLNSRFIVVREVEPLGK